MSFINFTFTVGSADPTLLQANVLRVGFSREGGRTEIVEHAHGDAAPRDIEITPQVVTSTQALKDALAGTGWLQDVAVTTAPGSDDHSVITSASWTTKGGTPSAAQSFDQIPLAIREVIRAASVAEVVASNAPARVPFVAHA